MILWSLTNWKRLFELNNGEQAYTVDVTSQIDGSLARVSIRAHEMTGQWVRPYEFIETLGKGGMGVVYLARRAGRWGQARALISSSGADTKPAISPDGHWIAYQSDVSGRAEVYLVSFPDGQATRQVTFNGGTSPAWSPNGQTLYFVAPQGLVSVSISSGGAVTDKPTVVYDRPFGL